MIRRPNGKAHVAIRDDIRRDTMVVNSWTLVIESKRLLLYLVERRFQNRRRAEDARLIARLRNELELAERKRHAKRTATTSAIGSERLDRTYARLIQRATTCSARLSTSAPRLMPSDWFKTAVGVQMLDELVAQWRKAASS